MKGKKLLQALSFFSLFNFSIAANATLIAMEWESGVSANTSLTYDSSTGLQWLDLPLTLGISYNDMSSLLLAGGLYDGFRYATSSELAGLITSAGFPVQGSVREVSYRPTTLTGYDNVVSLLDLIGATHTSGYLSEPGHAVGLLGDSPADDPSSVYSGYLGIGSMFTYNYDCGCEDTLFFIDDLTDDRSSKTLSYSGMGSFLVRNITPVPVPGSAGLLLCGLAFLLKLRRR